VSDLFIAAWSNGSESGIATSVAYGAGEGVAAIRTIASAAEIITEMLADARAELDRRPSPTVGG
jgi:hypothetical protein